jgi:hypothetical protein
MINILHSKHATNTLYIIKLKMMGISKLIMLFHKLIEFVIRKLISLIIIIISSEIEITILLMHLNMFKNIKKINNLCIL